MSNTPPPPFQQPQVVYVKEKGGHPFVKLFLVLILVMIVAVVGCTALVGTAANDVAESMDADTQAVIDAATVTRCEMGTTWPEATIEFTSPLTEEKGWISFEIAFLDVDGVQVATGTALFENIAPGETARTEASGIVQGLTGPLTCDVADASVL